MFIVVSLCLVVNIVCFLVAPNVITGIALGITIGSFVGVAAIKLRG